MPKRTREATEHTRREILTAGLIVFARDGYEAATLEAVAAQANVSRGAIYWHYANKRNLLKAILADAHLPIESFLKTFKGLEEGIHTLQHALLRTLSEQSAVLTTQVILLKSGWQPMVIDKSQTIKSNFIKQVHSLLESCKSTGELHHKIDSHKAANWLHCSVSGILLLGAQQENTHDVLDATLQLFRVWIRSTEFWSPADL